MRHRTTGELSAFVEVTVALEGIGHTTTSATDLMSNLQAGTAVFRFDKNRWVTDGRVILNLSPNEAIRFYQDDLEMVGREWRIGRFRERLPTRNCLRGGRCRSRCQS